MSKVHNLNQVEQNFMHTIEEPFRRLRGALWKAQIKAVQEAYELGVKSGKRSLCECAKTLIPCAVCEAL